MKSIKINGREFECQEPTYKNIVGYKSIVVTIIGYYQPETNEIKIVYNDESMHGTKLISNYNKKDNVSKLLVMMG